MLYMDPHAHCAFRSSPLAQSALMYESSFRKYAGNAATCAAAVHAGERAQKGSQTFSNAVSHVGHRLASVVCASRLSLHTCLIHMILHLVNRKFSRAGNSTESGLHACSAMA